MVSISVRLVLLVGLCSSSLGEEWETRCLFFTLERVVDHRSAAEVDRAMEHLLAAHPDAIETRLPPGPLRSAMAARLDGREALRLFRRALRTPELAADRVAGVAANLGSRADLAGLVLEAGCLEVLLPRHRRLLTEIAMDALLDGDRSLALRLLSDRRSATKTAEALCDLQWPEGIRLLADAVSGAIELPAEARAALATAQPNLSFYHPRPLDSGRVAALQETARTDEDHAMRLLAARVLLRVGTEDVFPHVVSAYAACRSVEMERWEWRKIGSWYHRRVFSREVPPHARLSVLRGSAQFGQIFASDAPLAAEELARDFRRLLEEAPDPRSRAELLRELDWLHVHLVDESGRRNHPVPAYRALLEELATGLPEVSPEVRALGREVSHALLDELVREPGHRYPRGWVPLPREPREETPDLSFCSGWSEPELRRMDPEEERALAEKVRTAADPFEAWEAARALDESDSVAAYSTLLGASERLWAADEGNSPSVPSAAVHVSSLEGLEALLTFVEDRSVSPCVRLAAFESLRDLWFEETEIERRRGLLHRVDEWVEERAPLLDSGLPEAVLTGWARCLESLFEEGCAEELGFTEPFVRRAFDAGIERVAAEGPRIRLREGY